MRFFRETLLRAWLRRALAESRTMAEFFAAGGDMKEARYWEGRADALVVTMDLLGMDSGWWPSRPRHDPAPPPKTVTMT
jgi:hypothetical protein